MIATITFLTAITIAIVGLTALSRSFLQQLDWRGPGADDRERMAEAVAEPSLASVILREILLAPVSRVHVARQLRICWPVRAVSVLFLPRSVDLKTRLWHHRLRIQPARGTPSVSSSLLRRGLCRCASPNNNR